MLSIFKTNQIKSERFSCYFYPGYLNTLAQLKPASPLELSIVRGNHTCYTPMTRWV